MCTNDQISQAKRPLSFKGPIFPTAFDLPTVAREPLLKYLNDFETSSFKRDFATNFPCWIATGARAGNTVLPISKWAASPITYIFLSSFKVKLCSTFAFPFLLKFVSSDLRRGLPSFPAAQNILHDFIFLSFT